MNEGHAVKCVITSYSIHYTKLYEDKDDPKPDDNKENLLPPMQEGDLVDLRNNFV